MLDTQRPSEGSIAGMSIGTRRVESGEGELLKSVRLAALKDTPSAFASTFERESANTKARWADLAAERSHGREHSTFFALDSDRVVGLVGGHRSDDGAEIDLVSMWTDPAERWRGIGTALVEAVIEWADGDPVSLWVTRGNDSAYRLYERCGFVETGDYAPLPSDPCTDETRMRREPT